MRLSEYTFVIKMINKVIEIMTHPVYTYTEEGRITMMKGLMGKNIHLLRENAGFTQSNIAQFLGVDQSLISKVEKGERTLTADMIEKLASLFAVNVEEFEKEDIVTSKLSFAFRGSEFDVTEMEAVAAINKIALNSEFMRTILEESEA